MKLLKRKQKNEEAEQVSKASITTSVFNLKGIFRKFAFLLTVLLFINVNGTSPVFEVENITSEECTLTKEQIYVQTVKERIHQELVVEVENYILTMAPDSKLNAEKIVSVCEKYDLNIVFVLAQGLLESHFGTKGVAVRTNSVWNVGTYDNGRILYTYKDPNESIEPYANLLHRNYLMLADSTDANDKDILNLLQDRGYINYDGKRFASARGYENAMRKLMVKIDMSTSIGVLQGIRNLDDETILSFFNPADDIKDIELYAEK